MAVAVDHVSKRYVIHGADRPRALKEALLRRRSRRDPERQVDALCDVSLEVAAGRTVGMIGPNGAGKSTLLRLIGGIGRPDSGRIDVEGRVGALLELGAGFHPDLTGREAAVLGAVVAGLTRAEAIDRLPSIISFAGLEGAIDDPIRTFSTGMEARLAFAVAVHVDPDVLLVDEVLAVGDLAFQRRCIDRIRRFKDEGVTILIVSHDPDLVAQLCDEVLWLRAGRVVAHGPPRQITERYVRSMADAARAATPAAGPVAVTAGGVELRLGENRWGNQEATVATVRVLDGWGEPCSETVSGAGLRVAIDVAPCRHPVRAHVGVTVVRADGVVCLDVATPVTAGPAGASARLDIERLDVAAGDYALDVGLYGEDWGATFDFHHGAYPLKVTGPQGAGRGVLAPPISWDVGRPP